jgi:hypothetical protein
MNFQGERREPLEFQRSEGAGPRASGTRHPAAGIWWWLLLPLALLVYPGFRVAWRELYD